MHVAFPAALTLVQCIHALKPQVRCQVCRVLQCQAQACGPGVGVDVAIPHIDRGRAEIPDDGRGWLCAWAAGELVDCCFGVPWQTFWRREEGAATRCAAGCIGGCLRKESVVRMSATLRLIGRALMP